MNAWTNDNTGHNRTIDTGPAPNGKPEQLLITVNYVQDDGAGNLHKAIALDSHIIPLILRVPEMRDTLAECKKALLQLNEQLGDEYEVSPNLRRLLARIEALTAPTREELDAPK